MGGAEVFMGKPWAATYQPDQSFLIFEYPDMLDKYEPRS